MQVCMHVCVYIYITYMHMHAYDYVDVDVHAHTYTHTHNTYLSEYVHAYTNVLLSLFKPAPILVESTSLFCPV